MNFFFRVDASVQIGTGHVYRCLSLAQSLVSLGFTVRFLTRLLDGHLAELIHKRGFEIISLPRQLPSIEQDEVEPKLKHSDWLEASQAQDANVCIERLQIFNLTEQDWILVDHFALDAVWESALTATFNCKIAVIDGQADRSHHADVLIDPTPCSISEKWDGLLESKTRLFFGFPYIPIESSFQRNQKRAQVRTSLTRLLIAFGGVDQPNYTYSALQAVLRLNNAIIKVDVVVGKYYPHFEELAVLAKNVANEDIHCQTDKMSELMLKADFAIGAGGTMVWERCMLWLPSIVTPIADNQIEQVTCLQKLGVAEILISPIEGYSEKLYQVLSELLSQPENVMAMSLHAKALTHQVDESAWFKVFAMLP